METTEIDVHKGMTVFGTDGDTVGTVSHVWTNVTDPTTGVTNRGYFKVDQGGILGIGAKELYIPFTAVIDCVPGENVTVDCTKDTCSNLFGGKPDFLEVESENASNPPLVSHLISTATEGSPGTHCAAPTVERRCESWQSTRQSEMPSRLAGSRTSRTT